jgi:hypothetical protein
VERNSVLGVMIQAYERFGRRREETYREREREKLTGYC